MDKLIINGGRKLSGRVNISGAKNAALPIMASTILSSGEHVLRNIPHVKDVMAMGKILSFLGIDFHIENNLVKINTANIKNNETPHNLMSAIRGSVLVLGPLVARFGKAKIYLPGGCEIGARPINLHLMGLKKLGASITVESGLIIAESKKLKGATIDFDIPTVTGTENIMLAACLAEGKTTIHNASRDPEVVDLASALISMGAQINGAGESNILIEGVSSLTPLDYTIIPDRIEAGTFMVIAGITGGEVDVLNCEFGYMESTITKLKEAGLNFTAINNGVRVTGPGKIISTNLSTGSYPGFPTDMQAQFMAMMCIASGESRINETVFENRFMHAAELSRMGANIVIKNNVAIISGVNNLKGTNVFSTDLRASVSLIIAALAAEGQSTINKIYHVERGYELLENKLIQLGADILRLKG